MRRLVYRLVLSLVAAFAVMALAREAKAATSDAPQCDARAATTFAPAPQLQDPETSMDLREGPCGIEVDLSRAARPDRSISWTPDVQEPVALAARPRVFAPRGARVPAPSAETARVPDAPHVRLDRPPRRAD